MQNRTTLLTDCLKNFRLNNANITLTQVEIEAELEEFRKEIYKKIRVPMLKANVISPIPNKPVTIDLNTDGLANQTAKLAEELKIMSKNIIPTTQAICSMKSTIESSSKAIVEIDKTIEKTINEGINAKMSLLNETLSKLEAHFKITDNEIDSEDYKVYDDYTTAFNETQLNNYVGFNAEELKELAKRAYSENLLFISVPGCGKTDIAYTLAQYITGYNQTNRILQIDLNETTDYSVLMCGLRNTNNGWQYKLGSIAKFCKLAINNRDKEFILILNELSRANIEAALGPMFTAMEYTYRDSDRFKLVNDEIFICPSNLIILSTMNASDKGVKRLDLAMLDRFTCISIKPLWQKLMDQYSDESTQFFNLCKITDNTIKNNIQTLANKVNKVNDWLYQEGYKDFIIGNRSLFKYKADYCTGNLTRIYNDLTYKLLELEDRLVLESNSLIELFK